MQISDWVIFSKKKTYRGYIVFISNDNSDVRSISVRLTSPFELINKVIMVREDEVFKDERNFTEIDLNELIDLSLLLKDQQWFEELLLIKNVMK